LAGLALAIVLGLAMALPCAAQSVRSSRAVPAPEQGVSWQALTPAQRSALEPLQSEWSSLNVQRKTKWLELAQRMPAMSAAERARIQLRMSEWARMTPADRGRARLQYQEARQMSPSDRQERWEAYQALPAEQRSALASKPAPLAARANGAAGSSLKKNVAPLAPAGQAPRTVAPTVVQARPGATTSLVNKRATGPAHSQAGLPKISASKGFVDPATLLPKRGAQGAAVAAAPPADKASSARR
jgi:hypothetical protein